MIRCKSAALMSVSDSTAAVRHRKRARRSAPRRASFAPTIRPISRTSGIWRRRARKLAKAPGSGTQAAQALKAALGATSPQNRSPTTRQGRARPGAGRPRSEGRALRGLLCQRPAPSACRRQRHAAAARGCLASGGVASPAAGVAPWPRPRGVSLLGPRRVRRRLGCHRCVCARVRATGDGRVRSAAVRRAGTAVRTEAACSCGARQRAHAAAPRSKPTFEFWAGLWSKNDLGAWTR